MQIEKRLNSGAHMESELRKDLVLELTLRFMSASVGQKKTNTKSNKNKKKINDELTGCCCSITVSSLH